MIDTVTRRPLQVHPSGGIIGGYQRSSHSRGVLEARHYMTAQMLAAAPPERDWGAGLKFSWWLNDRLGDCTIASQYHRRELLAQLNGETFAATDGDAIADYTAVSGWDGTYGDITDRGAEMVNVGARAKDPGLVGGTEKVAAIARLDVGNISQLRAAVNEYMAVWIGVDLPRAVDDQGYNWSMPPLGSRGPTDEPDRDRGHALLITGYDRDLFHLTTWASSTYTATIPWMLACLSEAYVDFDNALVTGARPAPNGFDLARLQADLAAMVA